MGQPVFFLRGGESISGSLHQSTTTLIIIIITITIIIGIGLINIIAIIILIEIGRREGYGDPATLCLNQLPLYPGSLVRHLQIGADYKYKYKFNYNQGTCK